MPTIQRSVNPQTKQPEISGADALTGINSLYDYIGELRGQLNSLIDAVQTREEPPPPEPKKRRFKIF